MREGELSSLIDMEDPHSVLNEVRTILLMIFPGFRFDQIDRAFGDVVGLFRGQYPGYRRCTTDYHNLEHTMGAFLAMARLMHGLVLGGRSFTEKQANLGLLCALMHETKYIQTLDDDVGTGAEYTPIRTERSIAFMDKYIADTGWSKEEFRDSADILSCTSLNSEISTIRFASSQAEVLGKTLGAAHLLGQMADRTYLEKLLFLFYELKKAGIIGYNIQLGLLEKTIDFYAMAKRRLAGELDGLNEYMRLHFKVRWNLDRDLYVEGIERNMGYLQFLGIVTKLS